MLKDCNYNLVRLLHDFSRINWYLKKHAKDDASDEGQILTHKLFEEIEADLEKYIEKLRQAIEGLSIEEKFR